MSEPKKDQKPEPIAEFPKRARMIQTIHAVGPKSALRVVVGEKLTTSDLIASDIQVFSSDFRVIVHGTGAVLYVPKSNVTEWE